MEQVPGTTENNGKGGKSGFQWLPEMDRVLIEGVKHGPATKHRAINKILEIFPQLTRGDCWRRLRRLRQTPELALWQARKSVPSKGTTDESATRPPVRRWTAAEDNKLMDSVGYETVAKIAQRLNRSERAVRFRLGALGVSARVTDGWSLRAIQKTLRVSPATLRRFIGTGALRVKDPRISAASVAACFEKIRESLDPAVAGKAAAILTRADDGFSEERTASLLGMTVADVKAFVCGGRLKVVDTYVTDRSFEEFCRRRGHEFNLALLDPGMRKWLIEDYGVPQAVESDPRPVCRAKKHVLITRACNCGRQVAGNAYFRHVKVCPAANPAGDRARAQNPGPLQWAA